ncbi:relaxase/mobilization nuclease domain-containing protein, partial [Campylobacter sp.]|uniref:relaxase/mobilization nuclease domain-containing protein n=1 Tax=Campylobacter sp. TaxID=205 RepID=UPI003611AC20
CTPETAKQEFRAARVMWQKEDGLQCHTVIQSFDDSDGLTPQQANKLGQETARRLAPGYQAMVYTHTDGEGGKTHNHIVINAVSVEDGKKLDSHGLLYTARNVSNEISREHGLHVIEERTRGMRFTQAEQALVNKGVQPWKDELREVVESARDSSRNMQEFREKVEGFGVRISERTRKRDGETGWTYQHPNGMKCRAAKLGEDYTPQAIARTMAQQPQREPQQEQARPTSYSVVVEEAQQRKAAQEEARKALEQAAREHQKSTKKRDEGYSRGR